MCWEEYSLGHGKQCLLPLLGAAVDCSHSWEEKALADNLCSASLSEAHCSTLGQWIDGEECNNPIVKAKKNALSLLCTFCWSYPCKFHLITVSW